MLLAEFFKRKPKGVNFKEIESISYNTNPDHYWKKDHRVDPEMLKNMFNYKLQNFS